MKSFVINGLQYHRKGFKQVRRTFNGIVEGYYSSAFKIRNHILNALLPVYTAAVILADYGPEDMPVALCQNLCLMRAYPCVWRAEKIRMNQV